MGVIRLSGMETSNMRVMRGLTILAQFSHVKKIDVNTYRMSLYWRIVKALFPYFKPEEVKL
jgi:ADP-glucose pyrophosphorylase